MSFSLLGFTWKKDYKALLSIQKWEDKFRFNVLFKFDWAWDKI